MKRLFAALLSLVLALLLMGCSSAPANDPTPGQADAPVEDKTDPPAGEQSNDSTGGKEDTNADDTGRDAQNTGEGQVGDYAVKITGVRLGKDYDGADAIILDYDFTNNSDETTSAMESLYFQLFQDGVELDFTIITGDDNYDSDSYMKDIRPGVTLSCQCAYDYFLLGTL